MTDKQAPESRGTEVADVLTKLALQGPDERFDGPQHKAYRQGWNDALGNARAALLATQRSTEPAVRGDAEALVIDAYAIPTTKRLGDEIKIQRTRQLDGSVLWKVVRAGECLNKAGDWEWEPMPSSRDDDFLTRCRFRSAQEAIDAALAQTPEGKDER